MFHLLVLCFCLLPDDLDHLQFDGVVVDTHGRRVAKATITARDVQTARERVASTDNQGYYRLSSLAPGEYQLRFEADGFRTAVFTGIKGNAGTTLRLNCTLNIANIDSSLIVATSVPAYEVDKNRTYVGGTISRVEMDSLPIESRNPLDLIFTLPGVAPPPVSTSLLAEGDDSDGFMRSPEEAGVFSLSGATPFSNNLTIEGLDNNDDRAARERFVPSSDTVEEVQVITNQFSAEYGRASGGRVNLRLRGGTNQLRGRTSYFLRDARLNANSFHRNADPQRGFRLPFTEHTGSATLGGPVASGQRNSEFFFFGYDIDFISDNATIAALVPVDINPHFPLPSPNGANLGSVARDRQGRELIVNGGAGVGLYDLTLSTPKLASTAQGRIDMHAGQPHSISGWFTLARQRDERAFSGGRKTPDTIRSRGRSSASFAISHTFASSDRLVNEARAQFSTLSPLDGPASSRPVVLIEIDDPRDIQGMPHALSRRGNLLAGSSNSSGSDRREARWQIQETLTTSAGKHTLRTGIDVHRISSRYVDLEDRTGTFYFANPADFIVGRPERFRQRFSTESLLYNIYSGLFLQDDYRAGRQLTLAAGIRWDRESIVDDDNNLAPRLGVAWSPRQSATTVVRAGFGRFFNRALLRTLDDFTLTSHSMLIDTNIQAHAGIVAGLAFPNVLDPADPAVRALAIREVGFQRRLEPGLRIPESYQASLGLEQRVSPSFKASATYIFSRGAHLWRETNVNAPRISLTGASSFSEFLMSRDFDNRRDAATGLRPITATGNADVVRFDRSEESSRVIQDGTGPAGRVVVFGLGNQSTSNVTSVLKAALAAVRHLRPDPNLEQVEELQSRGSSNYHGASIEVEGRIGHRGFIRSSYTISKLIDDGVVNTSSPLVAGDYGRERALSILDARHRIAASGMVSLRHVDVSFTFNLNSPLPFNIGIGGNDRNLDDVNNDRPNYEGDLENLSERSLSLPLIGSVGNLPRNAGRGPWQHSLNVRASRIIRATERMTVVPIIEAFNPFNTTVFSYGAEFVDWNSLAPRRTFKPRTLRVGLRVEF
jgi:hypothetical protein